MRHQTHTERVISISTAYIARSWTGLGELATVSCLWLGLTDHRCPRRLTHCYPAGITRPQAGLLLITRQPSPSLPPSDQPNTATFLENMSLASLAFLGINSALCLLTVPSNSERMGEQREFTDRSLLP